MSSFRKFVLFAVCLFLTTGGALTQEKKDSKKKEGAKEDTKAKPPEKMSFPVPVGHDSKGLKLPSFEDGKLKMLFNIGVANRVDENNVNMTDMQVETYKEDGSPELNIDLPVSSFNLASKVISTKQDVKITSTDWELTGKSLEFNTESREGRLGGGVKMIIYELATEPSEEESAAKPDGVAIPKVSFPDTDKKPTIKVNKPKTTPTPEPLPRE